MARRHPVMTAAITAVSMLILAGACAQPRTALPARGGMTTPADDDTASPARRRAHAAAFDRADRRARAVIEQIRCAQHVGALRQRGAFGPADSVGGMGQCTVVDGLYVGVFFDADTSFTTVSRFSAVDLAASTRRAAPLDTAAILAVAHATRAAQLRGLEAYQRAERAYAPVAFRFDGDSVEVWLIPPQILTGPPLTVGGERGFVFAPDGRALAREMDAFTELRTLPLPDTGVVRIPSVETAVPGLTELVLANLLHANGRRVAIDMRNQTAMLVGEGPSAVWMHVPRD